MPMEFLSDLWLPILTSGIVVFVLSWAMWMVMPHHRADWFALPEEDALIEALRAQGVRGPGQFSFPHYEGPETARDPAWIAKMKEGPAGFMVLRKPGPPTMGKSLGIHFAFCLVVSLFTAYVAAHSLEAGADGASVFRIAGTTALLAYAAGNVPYATWFGFSWRSTWMHVLDGVVYGLATGAVFAWLRGG